MATEIGGQFVLSQANAKVHLCDRCGFMACNNNGVPYLFPDGIHPLRSCDFQLKVNAANGR